VKGEHYTIIGPEFVKGFAGTLVAVLTKGEREGMAATEVGGHKAIRKYLGSLVTGWLHDMRDKAPFLQDPEMHGREDCDLFDNVPTSDLGIALEG